MKKLLLLLLLFGFSANGADKPIDSDTGLEGIAKDGMGILVEELSKLDKTLNKKPIENQVKLRLVQAGIKINKDADSRLDINATPIYVSEKTIMAYVLWAYLSRDVTFEANGKKYERVAAVWAIHGIYGKDNLREGINTIMDKFLLDYLKANPKKDK